MRDPKRSDFFSSKHLFLSMKTRQVKHGKIKIVWQGFSFVTLGKCLKELESSNLSDNWCYNASYIMEKMLVRRLEGYSIPTYPQYTHYVLQYKFEMYTFYQR